MIKTCRVAHSHDLHLLMPGPTPSPDPPEYIHTDDDLSPPPGYDSSASTPNTFQIEVDPASYFAQQNGFDPGSVRNHSRDYYQIQQQHRGSLAVRTVDEVNRWAFDPSYTVGHHEFEPEQNSPGYAIDMDFDVLDARTAFCMADMTIMNRREFDLFDTVFFLIRFKINGSPRLLERIKMDISMHSRDRSGVANKLHKRTVVVAKSITLDSPLVLEENLRYTGNFSLMIPDHLSFKQGNTVKSSRLFPTYTPLESSTREVYYELRLVLYSPTGRIHSFESRLDIVPSYTLLPLQLERVRVPFVTSALTRGFGFGKPRGKLRLEVPRVRIMTLLPTPEKLKFRLFYVPDMSGTVDDKSLTPPIVTKVEVRLVTKKITAIRGTPLSAPYTSGHQWRDEQALNTLYLSKTHCWNPVLSKSNAEREDFDSDDKAKRTREYEMDLPIERCLKDVYRLSPSFESPDIVIEHELELKFGIAMRKDVKMIVPVVVIKSMDTKSNFKVSECEKKD